MHGRDQLKDSCTALPNGILVLSQSPKVATRNVLSFEQQLSSILIPMCMYMYVVLRQHVRLVDVPGVNSSFLPPLSAETEQRWLPQPWLPAAAGSDPERLRH